MNTSETVRANLSDEAADEILRNTEWTKWADARDMIQAVYAKGRRAGAAAVPQVQGLTDAARDVLAERQRQISAEEWTPQHDDMEHDDGCLSRAAACYALQDHGFPVLWPGIIDKFRFNSLWPWDVQWWKPKDERRNLVRAGALILAAIERMDRATKNGLTIKEQSDES
jgi:hypothetical protein